MNVEQQIKKSFKEHSGRELTREYKHLLKLQYDGEDIVIYIHSKELARVKVDKAMGELAFLNSNK